MQADDPPYLSVGTAVSAKYKGAFCEAKVSKVVRLVKCKVTYKMGLGTATLTDEQIKGTLRVGQLVQAKHIDRKELVEATISKIQDCSQYTVVFDDGDITTLRRTALCLKSGRHFNESETLDQLPLTHPEHFGNPVVGGRRGRRNRQPKEDSSDGEIEEENEPDLEAYLLDLKRVVSVETTEKKRSKDNWFPGLVVIPSAQPTVRINMKDEYLIRSFKDGRYYTVPKKEVNEFNRELAERVDSAVLEEAIQKAIKFLDHNELPPHWEKSSLFHSNNVDSESDENYTDSSDDEPSEEKDRFVAQLYKFMDEAGTPLNKTPTISNQDIDLHRLFRIVEKMGGYNRVTNQNKWRTVAIRLHLSGSQSTFNQVKAVYKKCLSSYETFYRTLGVTMLNHTRPTKKNKGRSLIRDRDRSTPIKSPAPEKEEAPVEVVVPKEAPQEPAKSKKIEKKRSTIIAEVSDTNSSSDAADQIDVTKEVTRPKRERPENKTVVKEKKPKQAVIEKVKTPVDKLEDQVQKEDEEKVQNTRSKSQSKQKEITAPVEETKKEKKTELKTPKEIKQPIVKSIVKKHIAPPIPSEEEKKKGKKRVAEEKATSLEANSNEIATRNISIGDKLKVFYGSSSESKVTYEAKVIEIDKDQSGQVYLVHYTGWNTRYDEWIQPQRIAENLSAIKKAKRSKQTAASSANTKNQIPKPVSKRTRVTSTSARSSTTEPPRSTTPSSVTSSGSRTKSPATPATRSAARLRQDSLRRTRRISIQTDVSTHTESESEGTESDSEVSKGRSGTKSENDLEIKTYRRKLSKPPVLLKSDKSKNQEDEDNSKEDNNKPRSSRRIRRSSPEKSAEESEDEGNPPKGRDFDLNQIRSELKGFTKAIKVPTLGRGDDKETCSSSEDTRSPPPLEKLINIDDEIEEKKENPLEKSVTSEDIYEFKEPEPFEFESRTKLGEEKKRLVSRLFEDMEKTAKLRNLNAEKKTREPLKKEETFEDSENEDEEETIIPMSPPKEEEEDPFDKLVESPSFNLIKTSDKIIEKKDKVVRNISDDALSLFRDLPPDATDDYSGDMELSDCESQTQIFTTSPEKMAIVETGSLFEDSNFSKLSPDQNMLDLEFSSLGKTDEGGVSYASDEDSIREQIQRVIAQSSTDEESNDALTISQPSSVSFQMKNREVEPLTQVTSILGVNVCDPVVTKHVEEIVKEEVKEEVKPTSIPEPVETAPIVSVEKLQIISPALQETDSTLLESIVSHPPVSLNVKLEETAKELSNIKTGTKIADSILQKFESIKNEIAAKVSPKRETEDKEVVKESNFEISPLVKDEIKHNSEDTKPILEENPKLTEPKVEEKEDVALLSTPIEETDKATSPITKSDLSDPKKKKKILSRAYIEDSDTDSSDSEQLVIARSDEDSHNTSMDAKLRPDTKESDSSNMFAQLQTTDDSQSQEDIDFSFDIKQDIRTLSLPVREKDVKREEPEISKEEDPDPHLHSLLLCEEVIPRSPAPPSEISSGQENKPIKSVLEMPFASAPSTSNNKNMLLDQKKPEPSPPMQIHEERENRVEKSTVIDNTPPTTPDSSISNMSPRGDPGGLSPNLGDNESCKSNDVETEYPRQRTSSSKLSPYSEEDTQMMGDIKQPASCKKRRKSLRNSEDTMPSLVSKKNKKTRSRHNSDSDDTSEHSNTESTKISSYNRPNRSPRPSKYNFYVEFDSSLDSCQRIAILQHRLSELRKTYADVKAELAVVERRRKKIRRREREALKAAKQELACT